MKNVAIFVPSGTLKINLFSSSLLKTLFFNFTAKYSPLRNAQWQRTELGDKFAKVIITRVAQLSADIVLLHRTGYSIITRVAELSVDVVLFH